MNADVTELPIFGMHREGYPVIEYGIPDSNEEMKVKIIKSSKDDT